MSAHPTEQLSAYLDDDLALEARANVDAHLSACDACRAVLVDLRAIRTSATAWASTTASPEHDLWPGLAARLTGPRATADGGPVATIVQAATTLAAEPPVPWYRRRWSVGVPELALAATVVAAVASVSISRRAPEATPASVDPAPIIAEVESFGPSDGGVTPVNFADAQYDAAVRDLERVLLEQRARLDPRTVIVLERNLRVIDDAIRESRQALTSDPANALLNSHLASARRRKLDLLRRATLITEAN